MSRRNYLFLAIAFLTAGAGYWFYTNYKVIQKNGYVKTTTTQTTITRAPASSPKPRTVARAPSAPVTTNQNTELQNQLQLERAKLELQRQALDALRARRDSQLQQVTNVYPNQIGTNTLQIQNLLQDLQNQRLAASDVDSTANAQLREQTTAANFSRDQVDLNIQNLEQDIQNTRNALALGLDPSYAQTADEQARYGNLQTQLAAQLTQLQALKEQRLSVSANLFQQTQNINAASQSQKQNLILTQNEIQNQISSLRDENNRLQNVSTEVRMSMMPLSQQINQAEQAYQQSLQRVKDLESSIVR